MGSNLWCRDKNRFFIAFKINFPDGKVEIMNSQKQIGEEWRSFQCEARSALLHAIISKLDIFGELWCIVSTSTDWLNTPVNEDEITLI